ncbi:MAG: phosphatidate cytidylyltransferase [Sphaerochaetaceae bacterium]
MKPLLKRIILFCIALPALFGIIFFLPWYHHLAFALLAVATVLLGSLEMKNMLFGPFEKPLVPFWGSSLLVIGQYVQGAFCPSFPLVLFIASLLILWLFSIEIFTGGKDEFAQANQRIGKSLLLVVYPGLFSLFFILIAMLEQGTFALLTLFLLVFANDTFAYVFGMWLGRSNSNILAASPNKSLAGFVGGFVSTCVISVVWVVVVPEAALLFTWWQALILGAVLAAVSNLGDLIESVFKRGAKVKDSGTLMLGRGGILDSIDSLLASAPLFYLLAYLFA